MALKYLTNGQIVLSTQPYDFSKSMVNVTLKPRDSGRWKACDNDFPLDVVIRFFAIGKSDRSVRSDRNKIQFLRIIII